ncbi:hypothetical protein NE865_01398 [Phthorimaea operculella]|nr:hypothetical protein NE865_01398 [Phthorimaea operculella]
MSVSVGKLSEFRLSEGASWVTYTERLEQYLKVNKVAADMKVAVLIASVGDPTYDLMVDLCSPKKPVDVPYDDLVKLLQQHLEPTPSILAERYAFRHRKQNANESIAQYAAALKHLARTCDFKTNLTENLRDQFVCGISDEPTRQRLFYEGDPDFQKAFKIASSLESAAQNAAAVEQPRKEEGSIHAMQASARASGARRTGGGAAGGSGGGGAARERGAGPGAGTVQRGTGGRTTRDPRLFTSARGRSCFSCGSPEHTRETCKFRKYTCRICLQEGHIQRACPKAQLDRQSKPVYRLDLDVADGGERRSGGDQLFSYDSEEDDGYGDGPSGLYNVQVMVQSHTQHRDSEPVIADVEVEGRRLRMHVDTGSPVACISDVMYKELFTSPA